LLLKLPLLCEEIRGIRDFTLNPRLRTSRCCWTSHTCFVVLFLFTQKT